MLNIAICIILRWILLIKYNPDVVRNKGQVMNIPQDERIDVLVKIIKQELTNNYDMFCVKIMQLYYNDNYDDYCNVKIEDITDLVAI